MSAGSLHFYAHAGHEIRALEPSPICACGKPAMPECGRCDVCAAVALERWLDRKLELSRGELD